MADGIGDRLPAFWPGGLQAILPAPWSASSPNISRSSSRCIGGRDPASGGSRRLVAGASASSNCHPSRIRPDQGGPAYPGTEEPPSVAAATVLSNRGRRLRVRRRTPAAGKLAGHPRGHRQPPRLRSRSPSVITLGNDRRPTGSIGRLLSVEVISQGLPDQHRLALPQGDTRQAGTRATRSLPAARAHLLLGGLTRTMLDQPSDDGRQVVESSVVQAVRAN